MHNGEDNRLTHTMVREALMPALDHVEREWRTEWRAAQKKKEANRPDGGGALIIVGNKSQDKFFSNGEFLMVSTDHGSNDTLGLDYANAIKDPGFFPGMRQEIRVSKGLLTFQLRLEIYNPLVTRLLTFPRKIRFQWI